MYLALYIIFMLTPYFGSHGTGFPRDFSHNFKETVPSTVLKKMQCLLLSNLHWSMQSSEKKKNDLANRMG